MSDLSLIEQVKAYYNVLINPAQRGLSGTITLTKLKRALKKLDEVPAELSFITLGRLSEFRQANLIASADIALVKLREETRDVDNRLKQLEHLKHYIAKADCGWQAIGLSQRDVIDLEFALLCQRMQIKSETAHGLRHYKSIISGFLDNLSDKAELPVDDYRQYSSTLDIKADQCLKDIKTKSEKTLLDNLKSVEEGGLNPAVAVELMEEAFASLRESGLPSDKMNAFYTKIGELKHVNVCADLKSQYEDICKIENYDAGNAAMEKLEKELHLNGLKWADIGIAIEDAEKQTLRFSFAEVVDKHKAAAELFELGEIKMAFAFISGAHVIARYSDFALIGKNADDIAKDYKIILKAKLKSDFETAINGELTGRQLCWQIEDIEQALAKDGIGWSDIDPALNEKGLSAKIRPFLIDAATEETQQYLTSYQYGCIGNAERFLEKAKGDWTEIKGIEEVIAALATKGMSLPSIELN